MAYPTYSTLWEAFASGEDYGHEEIGPGSQYVQRTEDFYNKVIGPAFGGQPYEQGSGLGLGDVMTGYFGEFDVYDAERAEEEFRMNIGDPYLGASDPFAWEKVSRYNPEEAQQLLEGELFDRGGKFKGKIGEDYGLDVEKADERYTSGVESLRKGLSYEGLKGSQGLVSGTSGAVLRSGEGISEAEDILTETYKKASTFIGGRTEDVEGAQESLEDSLFTAMTAYQEALNDEKEEWYDAIMADVSIAPEVFGFQFNETGIDAFESQYTGGHSATDCYRCLETGDCPEGTSWGDISGDCSMHMGLQYDETGEAQAFREEGEMCAYGELYNAATGLCEPQLGVGDYTTWEDYAASEGVDEGLLGCTNPSSCNYNPNAALDDGSCDAGPAEGDCDCFGNQLDECGVCGGNNACIDDTVEEQWGTDPEGEGYLNCTAMYGPGWGWNAQTGQCEFEGSTGMQMGSNHCYYTGCPSGTTCSANGFCMPTGSGADGGDYRGIVDKDDLETGYQWGEGDNKGPGGTPTGGF